MTKEQSITLWSVEKANVNEALLTKGMKKLYSLVDKLINEGVIMYEDFVNDTIDAITDNIVANDGKETDDNRLNQVDKICTNLYGKYKEQYNNTKSTKGDNGLSENTTTVRHESGICEPCSTEGTSEEHTTETV